MPELPEVETVVRSLAPQLLGRTIVSVERLDWERMVETPTPAIFRDLIVGRRFIGARRRSKWVLLDLDGGWSLAVHLRMSGRLEVHAPDDVARPHVHLVLGLDDGRRLFFDDELHFTLSSPAAGSSTHPRHYDRFSQVADEVVEVRVLQGIHFRTADERGRRQGERIAQWIFRNFLRPLRDR